MALVAVLWVLLGAFDLIRSEFLPDKLQTYTAIWLLRYLSLETWMILFLLIVIGALLEGGYAAIEKRNAKIAEYKIKASPLPRIDVQTAPADPWMSLLQERQKLQAELQNLLNIESQSRSVSLVSHGRDEYRIRRERIDQLKVDIEEISKRLEKLAREVETADPVSSLLHERQRLEVELQPLLEIEECGLMVVPEMQIGKDEGDFRREKIERLRRDINEIGRQLSGVTKKPQKRAR